MPRRKNTEAEKKIEPLEEEKEKQRKKETKEEKQNLPKFVLVSEDGSIQKTKVIINGKIIKDFSQFDLVAEEGQITFNYIKSGSINLNEVDDLFPPDEGGAENDS